jgi:hypothetical protein
MVAPITVLTIIAKMQVKILAAISEAIAEVFAADDGKK